MSSPTLDFNLKGLKKTSEEWNKLYNIKILDPDGWDRRNFNYSWYEEKITKEEFRDRVLQSTIEGVEGGYPTRKSDLYLFGGKD